MANSLTSTFSWSLGFDLGFFGGVSSFGKPVIYNKDNIKRLSVTIPMAHQHEVANWECCYFPFWGMVVHDARLSLLRVLAKNLLGYLKDSNAASYSVVPYFTPVTYFTYSLIYPLRWSTWPPAWKNSVERWLNVSRVLTASKTRPSPMFEHAKT